MSERINHSKENVPEEIKLAARRALLKFDSEAERKILAGYDGMEALQKEALFRDAIGAVYSEAFLAGQRNEMPKDTTKWEISVIEYEGGKDE